MGKIFIICIVLLCMVNGLAALSCIPCEERECEDPRPCRRNAVVKDVCGCCDVCARVKGEICGGPWGIDGICAEGLTCVKPEPEETGDDVIIYDFNQSGTCEKEKKEKKVEKTGRRGFGG
ncbi:CRIM1 [Branchiostoma lanceolatum]|uniref:CRIM1 protein n=1 Tax=Branchiostoma lanceolatum TaxID=7740 RepID=A0A8J9ZF09_BRALA|nr:CRIM1 [Branchiostoma lanceolatum]